MKTIPIPPDSLSAEQQRQITQYVKLIKTVFYRVTQEQASKRTVSEAVEYLESSGFTIGKPTSVKDSLLFLVHHPALIFLVANNQEKRELVSLMAKQMTLTDKKLDIVPSDLFQFKPKKERPSFGMLAEELLDGAEPEPVNSLLVQPALEL